MLGDEFWLTIDTQNRFKQTQPMAQAAICG
jgi:hypothetical protein